MGKKSTNQPGIQQIAAETGVSTATVSRVFSRHPYVSDAVREKVLAAARKVGYAPTISTSRSLFGILAAANSSYNFGSYLNQIVHTTSRHFFEAGCNVQIFSRSQFPYILSNTFRGVVVFTESDAEFFRKAGIPCVVINIPVDGVFNVMTDHFESLQIAVEYLLKLGHRKIAFLHASRVHSWGSQERFRGWRETMLAAGIPESQLISAGFSDSAKKIPEAVKKLLTKNPTAMIVEGEGFGIMADHALKQHGIRIPEDLSLITFEHEACSEFMTPEHTTVCQDFEQLGICAAETLIQIALHPASRKKIPQQQLFHNHLIERSSCAPPKGKK